MMSWVFSISRPRWPARMTSPGGAVPVGGAVSVAHELSRADAVCVVSSSMDARAAPDKDALNRRAAEKENFNCRAAGKLILGTGVAPVSIVYGVLSNSILLWLAGFTPLVSRIAAAR